MKKPAPITFFSKRKLSWLIAMVSLCYQLKSQNADDAISFSRLNLKFLEHLVKEKIDEVRIQHGLKTLYNDSILYVAAKYHAGYLYKKGELSHEEPEYKEFLTPQKRAEYFGAVNYLVGENIAFTLINTPVRDKKGKIHTNSTYNQTATDLVTMWVNSPGHYKNIITPDYNATGLALYEDVKTGRIYAVQKFANILFKYEFKENKEFFSFSNYAYPEVISSFSQVDSIMHKGKHAFKLKTPKKPKTCLRCQENMPNFSFGKTRLEYKGKTVYLVSHSYDPIFKLLKKRKDGFALEIVTYPAYDCGNPEYYQRPSRRNGQCVFSGRVLKPVYRKKALRGFRPAGKNRKDLAKKITEDKIKKYSIKLGKIPDDIKDFYELNVAIIQKKTVCHIMHFSSFCGDTLERFYELPYRHDTISNTSTIEEDYRNILFSIPFKKNKTEYSIQDIKPITDSLLSESFVADTIVIRAFSSVEGTESANKALQEQRANNIANAISGQQRERLVKVITSEENWELFYKQMETAKEMQELKAMNAQQVKQKLEDTLLQKKLEKYLSLQRVAKIRLHAKEIITDKTIEKYLAAKIKQHQPKLLSLLDDDKRPGALYRQIDSMQLYMEVAYNKIQEKVISPAFFKNFAISNHKKLLQYNLDRLRYRIQLGPRNIDSATWAIDVYGDLVSLYNHGQRSFFINYNMLNIIQRHGKKMNVVIGDKQQNNYIEELLSFPLSKEERELTEKLGLNFWFGICRLPETEQPKDKLPVYKSSLENIYQYFKTKKLETKELNKLAAFFLYHSQSGIVNELLMPEYEQRKNNPEGLRILAKTNYQNWQEHHNDQYFEFLKDIHSIIGRDNWCPLFVGPCNISFQAFDLESFRDFYCKECASYLNYAKAPQNFQPVKK